MWWSREVKIGLVEGTNVADDGLLVFFVQLDLQTLSSHFEAVHLLNRLLCGFWVIETNKAYSLGFSVLFSHDSSRVDVSESPEEVVQLRILHVVGQVEKEEVWASGAEFSIGGVHIIEGVDFLLDVVAVGCVGVEHLCAWGRCLKLRLFGLVVVVIVLAFVIDLVVNVIDRVSEGI